MSPRHATEKQQFSDSLQELARSLREEVSAANGQWRIKGFVDLAGRVYTISHDTKVISKIIEIHLHPRLVASAAAWGYTIEPAEHQNYYPDLTYISKRDETIKFAVDLKTTYRSPDNPDFCNSFTLGSHGTYFRDRDSTKNIQYPYSSYAGHFCLGVIYSRIGFADAEGTRTYEFGDLDSITSVIGGLEFFAQEKWRIARDGQGSGNTANIGSIYRIADIVRGNGMFSGLGEQWFDDYWTQYGVGGVRDLKAFVEARGGDVSKVVEKVTARKARRRR